MSIESLETFTNGEASVVRVRTDDGEEGIGQIAPYNADIAATVFHRQVAPHALGRDPGEIESLADRVVKEELKFPGSYVRRALGGLDTALWDLRGKRRGAPVCELVGGEPERLAVYGSSMRRDIDPDDEAERLATLRAERGYDAFKIRVGAWGSKGADEDEWPGRTEELVPAVRGAVGDDAVLFVDANSAYTPERALEIDREVLAPNGVDHFEEPCPYWKLDWTAEVRERAETPVAGGEQDCFLEQWKRIVERPVVDVVQPDVCYVGGFTRALRVAELAAEAGLPCRPHSANHSMVLTFTLHLLAAIDNAAPYVEYSIEDHWAEGMLDPAPEVEDGTVAVPDGPGWGVEVDPEWLATAHRRKSER
jgi:L-alanine-DL-glutamate epimerase-like enolase superfamily enzyme